MNYQEYLEKRKEMMDEAQSLISAGKFEEADAKMNEVSALDERWDGQTKADANMRALEKTCRMEW